MQLNIDMEKLHQLIIKASHAINHADYEDMEIVDAQEALVEALCLIEGDDCSFDNVI